VGLQFVHESQVRDEPSATFLSGNGPLVEVLQGALHSTIFVRPMRNFILEYGVRKRGRPNSHVFVFDEAQRAWDIDYMTQKHSHPYSEPAVLLRLASELPDWGVVVGLVGEGQEIHVGEEAGMAQWVTALTEAPSSFKLHLPPHLSPIFQQFQPKVNERLNLTVSLRTHRAEHVQDWVRAFIAGDVAGARGHAQALKAQAFDMYVATDLLRAKRYAFERFGAGWRSRWTTRTSPGPGRPAADRAGASEGARGCRWVCGSVVASVTRRACQLRRRVSPLSHVRSRFRLLAQPYNKSLIS